MINSEIFIFAKRDLVFYAYTETLSRLGDAANNSVYMADSK